MKLKFKIAIFIFILIVSAIVFVIWPPHYTFLKFPHGKKFAFTIIDDTDLSNLQNIKPIYEFLDSLGLHTTKTVWALPTNNPVNWANRGQTLNDSAYRSFIIDLHKRGFEIASHGARGGSSTRPEIMQAMEIFKKTSGNYPQIYINHSQNRDDVYWGKNKLSFPLYRALYALVSKSNFSGEDSLSSYFWGDFLMHHVDYAVNFSFHNINILKINPSIPYFDDEKKYINGWFHTCDGANTKAFCELLKKENVDRLQREHGVCIIYTHFAFKFCINGVIDSNVRRCLIDVASRDGWFVPAHDVLEYLSQQHGGCKTIGLRQKLRIETLWIFCEKLRHGST